MANFQCFTLPSGGYGSFQCNHDGSSTVTPYSDQFCNTPSGSPYIVSEKICGPAGTQKYVPAYMTSVCNPTKHSFSGYYDFSYCAAPDVVFKYPLGVCVAPLPAGSSLRRVIYSFDGSVLPPKLEYSTYSLSDCSDVGSPKRILLTPSSTHCSNSKGSMALISKAALPKLSRGQRHISFFTDGNCSGIAQAVIMATDGCIPIPYYNLRMQCNPDGSTSYQTFPRYDNKCSNAPLTGSFTVQPSECVLTYGGYIKTTCAYKNTNTATPTKGPQIHPSKKPSTKPTKAPHTHLSTKPSTKPTKAPHTRLSKKPSAKPTRAPHTRLSKKPSVKPTNVPHPHIPIIGPIAAHTSSSTELAVP